MDLRRTAWVVALISGCGSASHSPGDAGDTTTPAATVQEAIGRVNYWRMLAGVAPVAEQSQVEAAAEAHLDFVLDNPSSCWPGLHMEVQGSGCAGFTGASPGARLQTQGYQWSSYGEVMAEGVSDPDTAVDLWIWDAYHRFAVLSPLVDDVGFGLAGAFAILDLSAPLDAMIIPPADVIVFPPPDLTGVPPSWLGSEEQPTPQTPPNGWPSGPVVSILFPTDTWTLTSVAIGQTGVAGDSEPLTLSTPSTDATLQSLQMSNAAFFYANAPLTGNVSYTVTLQGSLGGAAWTKTWAFTTAAQ